MESPGPLNMEEGGRRVGGGVVVGPCKKPGRDATLLANFYNSKVCLIFTTATEN